VLFLVDFKLPYASGKVLVGSQHIPKPNKGPKNQNVHLHSTITV
jgi:hypothetical protein